MLFPFLVGPFMRLSNPGRFLVFALCVIGYLVIGYVLVPLVTLPDALSGFRVSPFSLNVAYQFGFFRCLVGFVLGMLVYLGYREDWSKQLFSSGYTFLILVTGLLLCLHFAVPDIFSAAFFPCILLSAAYGSPALNAILGSKPLVRLGEWSFSIYLIHQPFLYQGVALMGNPDKTGMVVPKMGMLVSWTICLVFVVFILFVSYLSYRFVEVPARNYINGRWGG